MNKRTQTITAALIAAFAFANAALAGETSKDPQTAAQQLNAYATGWNVGAFGGANLFQSGRIAFTSPAAPGVSTGEDTRSQLNGVGGIEGGYTWSGWQVAKGVTLLPALDGEAFYTGSQYKGTGTIAGFSDTLQSSTINAYVFSVDPKLKLQIGRFRPYIGFGVGAAYLTSDSATSNVDGLHLKVGGYSDDFVLALQGLAGVETFIAKNWSIDIGYKYLDLVDPTLASGGAVPIHYQGSSLTEQIVTAGVHFYF